MNIGLVTAKQEVDLSEMKNLIQKDSEIDLYLFPEGYLSASQLDETSRVIADAGKWLVTSYSDNKRKSEIGIVINRKGKIVGEHAKTTLTRGEIEKGFIPGENISIIKTEFCKIGICVCYEMHFPEISREYKLQGARMILNPIGTGMFNEEQYRVWTSLGKIRAYENSLFTAGCSHFADAIPVAYVYDKNGVELLEARDSNRLFRIHIDIEKMTEDDDNCSLVRKRTPSLYNNSSS